MVTNAQTDDHMSSFLSFSVSPLKEAAETLAHNQKETLAVDPRHPHKREGDCGRGVFGSREGDDVTHKSLTKGRVTNGSPFANQREPHEREPPIRNQKPRPVVGSAESGGCTAVTTAVRGSLSAKTFGDTRAVGVVEAGGGGGRGGRACGGMPMAGASLGG